MSARQPTNEPNEPFGPLVVWADGRRSAVPEDFSGHLDLLAHIATCSFNAVMKARFADVCWLVGKPRRRAIGLMAISAYLDIARGLDRGEIHHGDDVASAESSHHVCDALRRALHVAGRTGRDTDESIAARTLAEELRNRATSGHDLQALLHYSELCLDFGLSEAPAEIAAAIEAAIAGYGTGENENLVIEAWRVAARGHHQGRQAADSSRCRSSGAERLVAQADAVSASSAMLAAERLAQAIAELGNQPGSKARKQELRHKLLDVQSRRTDEMTVFSQEIDLTDMARHVAARIRPLGLLDRFLAFACLDQSPRPEELAEDAVETMRKHPLSCLFGSSSIDREGKTIHRTAGAGFGDADQSEIKGQIARAETTRRHVVATGAIEVARNIIVAEHHISFRGVERLISRSPAVPPALTGTLAHGFTRFVQGDHVGATYILTPMLETIVRHVLKSVGRDVSTFDEVRRTQQDRSVSAIFDYMRPDLDEVFGSATTTDIDNVFLAEPGPQLRHAVAHGLLHDGSPFGSDAVYGCWLIFRLCVRPLVAHRELLGVPDDWLETA